jgi:hypothetical protein
MREEMLQKIYSFISGTSTLLQNRREESLLQFRLCNTEYCREAFSVDNHTKGWTSKEITNSSLTIGKTLYWSNTPNREDRKSSKAMCNVQSSAGCKAQAYPQQELVLLSWLMCHRVCFVSFAYNFLHLHVIVHMEQLPTHIHSITFLLFSHFAQIIAANSQEILIVYTGQG